MLVDVSTKIQAKPLSIAACVENPTPARFFISLHLVFELASNDLDKHQYRSSPNWRRLILRIDWFLNKAINFIDSKVISIKIIKREISTCRKPILIGDVLGFRPRRFVFLFWGKMFVYKDLKYQITHHVSG